MTLLRAAPFAIAAFLCTASASAQDDGPADAAFQAGRAALTRGDLAEACGKLAESDRLAPSGRAVLNLADCLERRGQLTAAYGKFLEAASRAVLAKRPDAERHARERALLIEPRLARVSVHVPIGAAGPGLVVTHDGVVVPPSQFDMPELADPGSTHTYEATAPGSRHYRGFVFAEGGGSAHATVEWEPTPVVAVKPIGAPRPEAPSRKLPYVVLGVGGAGVALGAVSGLAVLSAKGTVRAHCNQMTHVCDADGESAASRGRTYSVISPIGFGVGLASIALGSYLLVHKPRFAVTPTGAGVAAYGTF